MIQQLLHANKMYREGTPIMSDAEYDALIERAQKECPELLEKYMKDGTLKDIIKTPNGKVKLPFRMGSMNKIKTAFGLLGWATGIIEGDEEVILSPKFDGLALVIDEEDQTFVATRGDGEFGVNVAKHYFEMHQPYINQSCYSIGEAIIPKLAFEQNFAEEYKNPRNMVASLYNTKNPDPNKLRHVCFMRFGIVPKNLARYDKDEQLDIANKINPIPVPYKKIKIRELTKELLDNLYYEWSIQFELDGIIIDINSREKREELGRETNYNPAYARAYKGDFEEVKETIIEDIQWHTTKDGHLIPVASIIPIELEGATVSNCTLYNALYVSERALGKGARITVKRSGKVIPKIVEIIKQGEQEWRPEGCEWDGPHLKLLEKNDAWKIKEIAHFFKECKVEDFSEKSIETLYGFNFKSIESIIYAPAAAFQSIPGFGETSSKQLVENIHKALTNIPLERLQSASNCYSGLGEKTLRLFPQPDLGIEKEIEKFKISSVDFNKIEETVGIGEESISTWINGNIDFYNFYQKIKDYVILESKLIQLGDSFKGMTAVFSGFRDEVLQTDIEANGGKVSTSVSSKTTVVIVKEINGSSKIKKAQELGVKIILKNDFLNEYFSK